MVVVVDSLVSSTTSWIVGGSPIRSLVAVVVVVVVFT
jgi:hypothetical protein